MVFFKLFSLPIYFFFYSHFLNSKRGEKGYSLLSLLKGIIWFLPSMLIYFFMRNIFTLSYVDVKHYFYIFYTDFFLFSFLAVLGYLLLVGLNRPYEKDGSVKDTFSFFSGFFLGVNILYLILFVSEFSLFLLFILPFLRIIQVYFLTFFLEKIAEGDGFQRIVWIIALLAALFLLTFVQFFYKSNLSVFFIISSILTLAACPLSYYFLKDL